MRKALAAVGLSIGLALGAAAAAGAATPGPGDTQCVPGQDAQPGPAQVGGTCPQK